MSAGSIYICEEPGIPEKTPHPLSLFTVKAYISNNTLDQMKLSHRLAKVWWPSGDVLSPARSDRSS